MQEYLCSQTPVPALPPYLKFCLCYWHKQQDMLHILGPKPSRTIWGPVTEFNTPMPQQNRQIKQFKPSERRFGRCILLHVEKSCVSFTVMVRTHGAASRSWNCFVSLNRLQVFVASLRNVRRIYIRIWPHTGTIVMGNWHSYCEQKLSQLAGVIYGEEAREHAHSLLLHQI